MINDSFISKLYADFKLSDTEKEVLKYIATHIDEVLKSGVRGVAQQNYTSATTVVRLSKKLGFDGFREMIYSFKSTLTSSSCQLPATLGREMHFIYAIQDLQAFISILDCKGFVCIHGEGYSRLIAEYLEKKLISSACTAITQDYLEAETIITNFKHKLDAMIIISKSGNNPFALETARRCQEAQILTIAFTGNSHSDLKKYCNSVFVVKDDHPFDIENAQSNYFFGYCILAIEEIFDIFHNRIDT